MLVINESVFVAIISCISIYREKILHILVRTGLGLAGFSLHSDYRAMPIKLA